MPDFPTADDVARAIVAACRETGADPLQVASGGYVRKGTHQAHCISRARGYAAWALDDLFEIGSPACSRLVGIQQKSSAEEFLATLRHRIIMNEAKWFDAAALDRVKTAIIAGIRVADLPPLTLKSAPAPRRVAPDGPLAMKKTPVAAELSENMTGELMGDPPPGRSALAEFQRRAAALPSDAD